MRQPDGLREELALERAAMQEHERRAAVLWQERQYAAALNERAQVADAGARIMMLEGEQCSGLL